MKKIESQNSRLLKHFIKAGRITQRQAMADYSIQSLTKRISELRKMGYGIISNIKQHPITGQRYAEYVLEGRA
ncbi:hypothetical protein BSL82_03520 [Tardibacter chloracetimidivorans]|uniref:Winged helix-turn-helix domain-containing protein n=1 Tax=Tardibacter chloracetimidivorans TaxID=1921510 RepID=A0A1L3ZS85_9SPHN|nr:helix-turn-helix domain-containing protein [Tardibacter chloracetimidivorans]API58487.1 hypothetical protein BSL82_03520 [Tardibacter chloracetimidivorans]